MRTSALVFAMGLAGCGGQATGPEMDLDGAWTFVGHFSNDEIQVSCTDGGTAELSQTGSTFSGAAVLTHSCSGREGSVSFTTSHPIVDGQVDGGSVEFRMVSCSYAGTLSRPDLMTGSTTCSLTILGEAHPFEGQWQAAR